MTITLWLLVAAYIFLKHFFIWYVLIGSPFFILVGCVARSKGRSFIGWFLLSVFFSPLLALIALVAVPARIKPIGFDGGGVRITPSF